MIMKKQVEPQDSGARVYYGQRIANLRKQRGMTQQQLSDVVGVSREHIARILVKVAKALGMELEFV